MTVESDLEDQIASARQTIATDGYPMSVGELTNLYRGGELIIRPEFQRFYRWKSIQKSRLVESILLGIPLPSIFVSQTEDGVWEVVDGLQRLSTIFELQGELRDASGERAKELVLEATKYLPSLGGASWSGSATGPSLSTAQKLDIKRSKLDIKIIKRESSPQTKFDLFQRLNSYGSQLNSQEMRSALLVAVSAEFFIEIERLSRYESFKNCILLSEKQLEERYDMELVIRFLILHLWPEDRLSQSHLRDLSQVLDDRSVEMATAYPKGFASVKNTFHKTFDAISKHGDENVFRRWDAQKMEFRGPFLTSAFEIFALGLGYHISNNHPFRVDLLEVARELWTAPGMQSGFSTGRSTEARLVEYIPLGRARTRG